MKTIHLAAAVIASLSCALVTASCVLNPIEAPESDGSGGVAATEPSGEAAQPAYEDVFHFVEQVKDDGEGAAGGWQRATAVLKFSDWRKPFAPYFWRCPIEVGMPIRAELQGRISSKYAAKITAEIATAVTDPLMHSRVSWVGESETYCRELYRQMQQMLRGPYHLGATVKRP